MFLYSQGEKPRMQHILPLGIVFLRHFYQLLFLYFPSTACQKLTLQSAFLHGAILCISSPGKLGIGEHEILRGKCAIDVALHHVGCISRTEVGENMALDTTWS
jgi:hypothetical protein